jgi:hypothetical protein
MRRILGTVSCLSLVFIVWAAAACPQTLPTFKSDPIRFFSPKTWRTWVGKGQFFGRNYTDTLNFTPATAGGGLTLRRTLVDTDSVWVVSRGSGIISPDSTGHGYVILWTEKSYPPVTGHMNWQESQWRITFDGSWREWNLGIHQDSTMSLNVAVSRLIPGVGGVDVAAITYRRVL